jgi:hypothetical protein
VDQSALIALLALAACGGGGTSPTTDAGPDASQDAKIKGPCWPIDNTTPGGEIEVGTGVDAYAPMPDSLPLVFGDQQGYHITARARIRGMNPGVVGDLLNENELNPRTKYWAIALENEAQIGVVPCPYQIFYEPAQDGDGSVFPAYVEIRFDVALTLQDIVDKQYRVIVEVIDADGKYAKGEKVITAIAPE